MGIVMNEQALNWPKQLAATIGAWCEEKPIRLCLLFGSQATGKAHAKSDVDIALWPAEPVSTQQRLRWLMELEMALERDVSLVIVTPQLNPVLGFEMVKNGRVLHEAETDLWRRERSRLWHAYVDSRPFRRAARRQLQQFAEEVRRGS
jgi:predicted nucleotidyltransferase